MERKKYYTAKYDSVFLAIVTRYNEILKSIVESAIEEEIEEVVIVNSKLYKNKVNSKSNFLDLVVKTEKEYINIEINTNCEEEIINRNVIYLCNLLANITKKGDKPKYYNRVKQINLMFGDKKEYTISRNKLYDEKNQKVLTEIIEIININVDKLKEKYYNGNKKLTNKLPIIMLTLGKEELEEIKEESEQVKEFMRILEEMNDEGIVEEMVSVEEENKWYEDVIRRSAMKKGYEEGYDKGIEKGVSDGFEKGIEQGIEQGLEKGIEQNQKETAKNMLNENLDINLISKITSLSIEEIYAMKHI